MIEVLSKDYKISGDEGWWTGKCNGKVGGANFKLECPLTFYHIFSSLSNSIPKVGVFPCNFVAPCDLDFSDLPKEELRRFYPPHIRDERRG